MTSVTANIRRIVIVHGDGSCLFQSSVVLASMASQSYLLNSHSVGVRRALLLVQYKRVGAFPANVNTIRLIIAASYRVQRCHTHSQNRRSRLLPYREPPYCIHSLPVFSRRVAFALLFRLSAGLNYVNNSYRDVPEVRPRVG